MKFHRLLPYLTLAFIPALVTAQATGPIPAEPQTAQPQNVTVLPSVKSLPRTLLPVRLRNLRMDEPTVRARIRIGPDGKILDFICFEATHRDLIPAAKFAIENGYYNAGTIDGEPIVADLIAEIHFQNPALEQTVALSNTGVEHIQATMGEMNMEAFAFFPSKPSELDTPPTIVERRLTMVPVDENENPISGGGVFEFFIDADGHTHMPTVIRSDHPEITKAALFSIREMTFNPPLRNGQPTTVKVRLPLDFN